MAEACASRGDPRDTRGLFRNAVEDRLDPLATSYPQSVTASPVGAGLPDLNLTDSLLSPPVPRHGTPGRHATLACIC